MKRFVRFETQLDNGTVVYRATVYAEGTVENPGEKWLATSGWHVNKVFPYLWLESSYPELASEWGERA